MLGSGAFQGGGGETTKSKATPKKSTGSSKTVKPKPSPSKSTGPKTVRTAKVVTVKLTINVNEPKSEIFLTGKNGNGLGASGTAFTADDGSPYTIDNLRPGFYTVIIKKAGFIDFRRQIEITGKTPPVNVTLIPAVAFLSISCPGVPDAMIEIDGVGRFTGSVEPVVGRVFIVNISRRAICRPTKRSTLRLMGDHVIRIFALQRVR
ncbi:MAG: carboxypeptidase regulatory-like domain-containing protein [Acidobacteria bacterium]|nr:carboxypeptidase regulatory-like domain-containing protein [Acidobacteriota bacterium]